MKTLHQTNKKHLVCCIDMATPNPGKIYEKYLNGESLTNVEVNFGAAYFRDLADKLVKCGPAFSLAFKEANVVYMRLEDFQDARMRK